jgi:ribosome-binding protein aMBF1 (putative translation factor)
MKKTKAKIDLVESLKRRYINTDRRRASYKKAYKDAEIASKIYELRQQAGLSQKQLAELIGTKQPVISRLEEADYRGHSLEMLRRIATALQCRLEVDIVPDAVSHKGRYAHTG